MIEVAVCQTDVQLQIQVGIRFDQFWSSIRTGRPTVGGVPNRHVQLLVDEDLGDVEVEIIAWMGMLDLKQSATAIVDLGVLAELHDALSGIAVGLVPGPLLDQSQDQRFQANLSVIDLLFNEGPSAPDILQRSLRT